MVFPYDEFRGLVNRVIEVVEDSGSNDESRSGGKALLIGVHHRIVESGDIQLISRVDAILNTKSRARQSFKDTSLRELIVWISRETNPGSVFVLKRTDKLGDRQSQEIAIRSHFSTSPTMQLWFAPERTGQKRPAMLFIGFQSSPPPLSSTITIDDKIISCYPFNYNDSPS
jgi:hypothetical protein